MSKTLIIAEKPSVATDLARVLGKELGKFTRDKSGAFYQNDRAIITSAVGHLLEQKKPMTEEGKSLPWKFDYLPVIPRKFELEPIKQSEDRLKKVLQLARSKDVTEIVNACDAGREGELIFRLVYEMTGCRKPVLRLWISSMEDSAIREGFSDLRPGADYEALYQSALCRQKADWLVGINATRLFSVLYHRTVATNHDVQIAVLPIAVLGTGYRVIL